MSATADAIGLEAPSGPPPAPRPGLSRRLWRNPTIAVGASILALILLMGLAAPMLTSIDPAQINPVYRNKTPGSEEIVRRDDGSKSTITHWMGTDSLGRDI